MVVLEAAVRTGPMGPAQVLSEFHQPGVAAALSMGLAFLAALAVAVGTLMVLAVQGPPDKDITAVAVPLLLLAAAVALVDQVVIAREAQADPEALVLRHLLPDQACIARVAVAVAVIQVAVVLEATEAAVEDARVERKPMEPLILAVVAVVGVIAINRDAQAALAS